jgi:chitinase
VADFGTYLDYITIMNYDVNQGRSSSPFFLSHSLKTALTEADRAASANPGPNAPLKDCSGTSQPGASAQGAIQSWTGAQFPASHILMGVPAYGYVSDSTATSITSDWDSNSNSNSNNSNSNNSNSNKDPSDEDDDDATPEFSKPTWGPISHSQLFEQGWKDARTRQSAKMAPQSKMPNKTSAADNDPQIKAGLVKGQQATFNAIVASGALVESADGTFTAAGGFTRGWDSCSSTVRVSIITTLL